MNSLLQRLLVTVFIAATTAGALAQAADGGSGEPQWKIGRAVAQLKEERNRREWIVKISLRNEGALGREPVSILGRWKDSGKLQRGGKNKYVPLARFSREVALKRTAIVEVSLRPLGSVPRGQPAVELVVETGRSVTDRRTVSLSPPR